jgi:hypothetical protein
MNDTAAQERLAAYCKEAMKANMKQCKKMLKLPAANPKQQRFVW